MDVSRSEDSNVSNTAKPENSEEVMPKKEIEKKIEHSEKYSKTPTYKKITPQSTMTKPTADNTKVNHPDSIHNQAKFQHSESKNSEESSFMHKRHEVYM